MTALHHRPANQAAPSQLWDTDDLAAYLKVTPDTIKRMRTDGSGPAYITIRRAVRYVPGHVRQWLDGQAKHSTRTATERKHP